MENKLRLTKKTLINGPYTIPSPRAPVLQFDSFMSVPHDLLLIPEECL